MGHTTCSVALMLDLRWPYKRHAEVCARIQRFAGERDWGTVIAEFAHDTLRGKPSAAECYDGVIAQANRPLTRHAAAPGVPVVNVWPISPAQEDTGRLVVHSCHRRGWRVQGDVAIIAGKNQQILCARPRSSLTSVEIGYDQIG